MLVGPTSHGEICNKCGVFSQRVFQYSYFCAYDVRSLFYNQAVSVCNICTFQEEYDLLIEHFLLCENSKNNQGYVSYIMYLIYDAGLKGEQGREGRDGRNGLDGQRGEPGSDEFGLPGMFSILFLSSVLTLFLFLSIFLFLFFNLLLTLQRCLPFYHLCYILSFQYTFHVYW